MQQITFEQIPETLGILMQMVASIDNLLRASKEVNVSQGETDKMLTVEETACFLNLKKATIYTMASRSQIPVNKAGARLYFSQKELTEWIKGGRKKTLIELSDEADKFLKNNSKKRTR